MSSSRSLTPREWTIVDLLIAGENSRERASVRDRAIARTLGLSRITVANAIRRARQAAGVETDSELIAWAKTNKAPEKNS